MEQSPNTPDWFNQAPTSVEPSEPKSRKPLIIVVLVAITIVILALSALANRTSASTCFTADDYAQFYDVSVADTNAIKPGGLFFATNYLFVDGKDEINTEESDVPSLDADNIATLYRANPERDMTIDIEAGYAEADAGTQTLAKQRAATVKKTLTNAGVPEGKITTTLKSYDPGSDEEAEDTTNIVHLTIRSSETCRQ